MKSSGSSLFTYLKQQEESKGVGEIKRICDTIIKVFVDHEKEDRVIVPLFRYSHALEVLHLVAINFLRFLDKLFDSGCLTSIISDQTFDFNRRLLKLVQLELAGCKDIYKLMDGIAVLCQFIQVSSH